MVFLRLISRIYFVLLAFLTFSLCGEGVKVGTLVKTPDGLVPVETLAVGDEVMTLDQEGKIVASVVKAVQKKQIDKFVAIASSKALLETDPDQTLYVLSKEKWIKARDLQKDDTVFSVTDGKLPIDEVQEVNVKDTVYLLTVENNHNFFASESEILTHNFYAAVANMVTKTATNPKIVEGVMKSLVFFISAVFTITDDKSKAKKPTNPLDKPREYRDTYRYPYTPWELEQQQQAAKERYERECKKIMARLEKESVVAVEHVIVANERQMVIAQVESEKKEHVKQVLEQTAGNKEKIIFAKNPHNLSIQDIIDKNMSVAGGGDGPNNKQCWCGDFCNWKCTCECYCFCGEKNKAKRQKNLISTEKNGTYHDADYHHKNSHDGEKGKNNAPKNGQKALNNSIKVEGAGERRIGVSEGEIVMLCRTSEGVYHGHVRTFEELKSDPAMNATLNRLMQEGLINSKGKVLQ